MTTSIDLYAFSKAPNVPSASGFCQKLETFFRATSLSSSYTQVNLDFPAKAPKGKLPYVVIKSQGTSASRLTIADSHFIIQHLVATGLAPDLDASLSPAQKAESKAFQVWTEELLYPAVVCTRFGHNWQHNYDLVYRTLVLPPPLNSVLLKPLILWNLRRNISNAMVAHGIGRHTKEEVESRIREWVDAVAVKVGDEGDRWFHGTDSFALIDVILGAFLMHTLSLSYNQEIVDMIKEKKGLLRYTLRATELWFPEYDDTLKLFRTFL